MEFTSQLQGYKPSCIISCLVAKSGPTLCNTMNYSPQAPLFIGFPRQNIGVGCHFLLQGDLSDSRIKPASPALADRFFTTEPPGYSL